MTVCGSLLGSLRRLSLPHTTKYLTCQVLMRYRAEFLIRHHAREYFFITFHTIDEQLIKNAVKIRREIRNIVRERRLGDVLILFSACAYLIKE